MQRLIIKGVLTHPKAKQIDEMRIPNFLKKHIYLRWIAKRVGRKSGYYIQAKKYLGGIK